MMTNVATNAGRKVNEQIARYLENPVGSSQRAAAVREVIKPMAKAKRKRSAAQIAATKRMLAAAAAKRAGHEELEENPKMATKKAGKKTGKKKAAKKKAAKKKAASKKPAKRAAAKKTGKSSKQKRKRKAKAGGVATGWGAAYAAGAAAARAAKPAKKRGKKKAAAKKGKSRKAKTQRSQGKAHIVKLKGAPKVQYVEIVEKKKAKKRKGGSKKKLMENPFALAPVASVGTFGGLFENPIGPLSKDSLVGFGWAAAGTAIGLTGARLTDRFVATMAPGKSKSGVEGKHAWYGRDAAAMINRRPGALRYGVQAGGALAGMVAAYATRNVRVLPWLFGGLALGYGSNLLLMALEWAILPKILKGDTTKPETMTSGLGGLGNRLLPMEQDYVQDALDKQLEDWSTIADLAASQANEKPVAPSPLATPQSAYTLGEGSGGPTGPLSQAVSGLIPTGRVGECASCRGNGGCYSNCPEIQSCGPCANGGGGQDDGGNQCEYTVQPDDDLQTLLDATGVTVSEIEALNGGRPAQQVWQAGNTVVLPYAACVEVVRRLPPPVRQRIPVQPERPYEPPPVVNREPVREPVQPTIPAEPLRPVDRSPSLVRANMPLIPVPSLTDVPVMTAVRSTPTIAGVPTSDAEKERRLRGIGRDDRDD